MVGPLPCVVATSLAGVDVDTTATGEGGATEADGAEDGGALEVEATMTTMGTGMDRRAIGGGVGAEGDVGRHPTEELRRSHPPAAT